LLAECDPSVSIHGIEADQQVERRRELLADELAHVLDLREQRLDLGARGGIADGDIERQRDRVELREGLRKILSDRPVQLVLVGQRWSAVLKPPGPA
jgi:hypothetical protein